MKTVGLIPCAGKGSRLGLPFSKEMYPDIHSSEYRPLILHTIDAMKQAGITDIIITFNPLKTDLLTFLGNGKQLGVSLTYCMHPVAKSLPESLNEAAHLLDGKRVVFAMPDTVIHPLDFVKQALEFHEKQQAVVTLGCFRTQNPSSVSVVDFEEDGITVNQVIEKPEQSALTWMWGMMVWEGLFSATLSDFCAAAPKQQTKELYLSDALAPFIPLKAVKGLRFAEGDYQDLGTFEALKHWGAGKPEEPNQQ